MRHLFFIFILFFTATACGLLGSDANSSAVPGKIVFAAGATGH